MGTYLTQSRNEGQQAFRQLRASARKKIWTSNIEHRTPNFERGIRPIYGMAERSESILRRSMLDVRCSMFKKHLQVPGQSIYCAKSYMRSPGPAAINLETAFRLSNPIALC